jgi:hypothetical protein
LPVYLWQCPWDSKMARARSATSESYGSREYPEKRPEKMPVREVLATKLGSSIRRVCAGRGGAGDLCTRLVKCHFFEKIPAYRSPRFWVDLIQRQTGKIRWHPSHCLSEPETGMACLTTSWPLLAVSIAL